VDSNGDLLVADSDNNRVLLWPATDFNASSHPSCATSCYLPAAGIWGQYGSFLGTDSNAAHTSTGSGDPCPANQTGSPTQCTLSDPLGVLADARGDLLVADTLNNRVLEYDGALTGGSYPLAASGVYGQGGSFSSATPNLNGLNAASLQGPSGLAVDPSGDLWIADQDNSRVLELPHAVSGGVLAGSTATWVLGQRGSFAAGDANNGGADAGSLDYANAIVFDAAGNAFVSDSGNSRLLEYLQPYALTGARIVLMQGWNLVGLPSKTTLSYTASRAVSQIDAQGGNATEIAVYQNGAYQVYSSGLSTDFSLNAGEGFWVLTAAASTWTVT
jgi:sugar lactone lactonase YvrE